MPSVQEVYDSLPDSVIAFDDDGNRWYLLPTHDSSFIHLGVAPKPQTAWQNFVYHVAHGLLMHFPLRDILIFAWRNRHIEEPPPFTEWAIVEYVTLDEYEVS